MRSILRSNVFASRNEPFRVRNAYFFAFIFSCSSKEHVKSRGKYAILGGALVLLTFRRGENGEKCQISIQWNSMGSSESGCIDI